MSEGVSDWVFCALVDRGTFILPGGSCWLGSVEFSPKDDDDAGCRAALESSMAAYAVSPAGEGWERLVRARAVVVDVDADAARREGAFIVREALRLFSAHLTLTLAKLVFRDAGYLYDMKRRRAAPLLPPRPEKTFGISAMLNEVAKHPYHTLNTLLAAPRAFGELGQAFRRSAHWRTLAAEADDEGERLLLQWMAVECLCKVTEDEMIGSKLLASLGMPGGRQARLLSAPEATALSLLPNYTAWRRQLIEVVEALRDARNRIVHAGYRHVDLPSILRPDHQRLGQFLLPLACQCLADMALMALNLKMVTLEAMWSSYPRVLDERGVAARAEWFLERLAAQ